MIHDVFINVSWILTKHSIAQNHGLFLTLVSVFIEHDSHVCSKPMAYFFPPFITMVLFQNIQFYTGYAQSSRCNIQSKLCVFYIMGSSDHITHGHNVTQEFQMEPAIVNHLLVGCIRPCHMAKVYFVWLIVYVFFLCLQLQI
jgi:hypothetical protein